MTGISHTEADYEDLAGEAAVFRALPKREQLTPGAVHIGFGNFSRAFVLDFFSDIAETGRHDWGVVAVAPSDRQEFMINNLRRQNFMYTLIMRNGYEESKMVNALSDVLIAQRDPAAVIQIMADQKIKAVTATVTQQGYCVDAKGNLNLASTPALKSDIEAIKQGNLSQIKTMPGWVAAALLERFRKRLKPFALVSCDNLPQNGDLFRRVIKEVAKEIGEDFKRYVKDEVLFPNTVVDRIAPHQNYDRNSRHLFESFGIVDRCPVECEPYRRWLIEDIFPPKDKPPLDEVANVSFVPSIEPYAYRKLLLLNGSHLAIGIVSKMLQISNVKQATEDKDVRSFWLAFLHQAAYALEKTTNIPVSPFQKSVIERLDNPSMTDNVDRLLSSTSSKVRPRLLNKPAINKGLPSQASAFAVASWLHYMQGRDVSGNPYNLHEKDQHKLQRLGLTDPSSSGEKLLFFLAGQETAGPAAPGLKRFVENVIEEYKLILHAGLRKAIQTRFRRESRPVLGL